MSTPTPKPMRVGVIMPIAEGDAPGGAPSYAEIRALARQAEAAGFDSIWVMDHHFQIRGVGPAEEPMLEGFTALGYIAGLVRRARLGLMVGGVHYRQPGLWLKGATTLDVLTRGRSYFGIGAAWNQEESLALGFAFPELRDRFRQLEDTLRLVHAGWTGERGTEAPLEGKTMTATTLAGSLLILAPSAWLIIGAGRRSSKGSDDASGSMRE